MSPVVTDSPYRLVREEMMCSVEMVIIIGPSVMGQFGGE
jgi:hypothetical protein